MSDAEQIDEYAEDLIARGVRRIHVLAWRDLEDSDAGGSELHAHEFMRRFAAAGLTVLQRTSAAPGLPARQTRAGYDVLRRGSRFTVFPRAVASEITGRMGRYDALIEVWNGVPWLSPLWCRKPRIMFLHHVHGRMWDQILPAPMALSGRTVEARLAPPFYRRTVTLTPSDATRDELLGLGFRAEMVTAVPNGVEPYFEPGGERAPTPLVVGVGRLAPVKRFEHLFAAALHARQRVPDLQLVIVGEGPTRVGLERLIDEHDAAGWVSLTGRLDRPALRDLYRRAWLVVSASMAEGWGLTMTEAAACGVPTLATNVSGHRSSVVDGVTGSLVELRDLGPAMADLLLDDERRQRMGAAGLARARTLTWNSSALGVIRALHSEVVRRQTGVRTTSLTFPASPQGE